MGKLVPIAIVVVALAAGAGAGHLLRPAPVEVEDDPTRGGEAPDGGAATGAAPVIPKPHSGEESVVSLRDNFVVPVLRDGRVWSYVVLTLGVVAGATEGDQILLREPLLRDGLMEALFLHGSLGGFENDFTEPQAMIRLRRRLDDMVERRLGDPTARILIVSMARQAT